MRSEHFGPSWTELDRVGSHLDSLRPLRASGCSGWIVTVSVFLSQVKHVATKKPKKNNFQIQTVAKCLEIKHLCPELLLNTCRVLLWPDTWHQFTHEIIMMQTPFLLQSHRDLFLKVSVSVSVAAAPLKQLMCFAVSPSTLSESDCWNKERTQSDSDNQPTHVSKYQSSETFRTVFILVVTEQTVCTAAHWWRWTWGWWWWTLGLAGAGRFQGITPTEITSINRDK